MADPDCLFCKIVAGEGAADEVYSDEHTYAFRDVNPQAPTHVLVIPREHYRDLVELGADAQASAQLLAGIRGCAAALGLEHFRTVFNTGTEVGQSVPPVHGHLLAGRPMGWPPG